MPNISRTLGRPRRCRLLPFGLTADENGPRSADGMGHLEGVEFCDQIWGLNLFVLTTGNGDSWLFMFGFNHLHYPQNDLISMFLLLVDNISLIFPRLLESIPKFDDKMPSLDYFIYHITTISRSIPSWSIRLLGLPMKNSLSAASSRGASGASTLTLAAACRTNAADAGDAASAAGAGNFGNPGNIVDPIFRHTHNIYIYNYIFVIYIYVYT